MILIMIIDKQQYYDLLSLKGIFIPSLISLSLNHLIIIELKISFPILKQT